MSETIPYPQNTMFTTTPKWAIERALLESFNGALRKLKGRSAILRRKIATCAIYLWNLLRLLTDHWRRHETRSLRSKRAIENMRGERLTDKVSPKWKPSVGKHGCSR